MRCAEILRTKHFIGRLRDPKRVGTAANPKSKDEKERIIPDQVNKCVHQKIQTLGMNWTASINWVQGGSLGRHGEGGVPSWRTGHKALVGKFVWDFLTRLGESLAKFQCFFPQKFLCLRPHRLGKICP